MKLDYSQVFGATFCMQYHQLLLCALPYSNIVAGHMCRRLPMMAARDTVLLEMKLDYSQVFGATFCMQYHQLLLCALPYSGFVASNSGRRMDILAARDTVLLEMKLDYSQVF